ncbi:hypothetical protein SI65_03675 [Aspergillus cristatus]|uniref:Xylanolytic transcriptional activator regulatory domain-containing protein n=1 Tax=Aspergillus cristatus TaxID=573508 RepID=A0A1E3BI23_ASPCR|nr:hypothetical protein SI65_03675 [Aspergillus cristatus]
MQAGNLTAIEYGTNDGIEIHCDDEDSKAPSLDVSDNELAMCQSDGKGLFPFLVDNDAGWMAEASAIFSESTVSEIPIPSFGNLEMPGSAPTLTWSPQFDYQLEHTSTASMSQASSDTPSQSSLDHFHRMWPHIHRSTIQHTPSSGLLGQALQSVSHDTMNILGTVNLDEVAGRLLLSHPTRKQSPSVSLHVLQVLSVLLITTISQEMTPAVANWAAQWIEIAVSAMRRLEILTEEPWKSPNGSSPADDEAWVRGEESKRLVYTMLRVDAYLSLITGRPSSLRVQELELPLPVTEDVWTAPTIEARRQLYWFEPAGRTWTTLSAIVRDGLIQSRNRVARTAVVPPLLSTDSHLVLCALQGEIWAVTQETYGLNHGTLDSRPSWRAPESVHFWHDCLVDWKTFHDGLEPSKAQIDDPAWNSLNQIQYRLCQLTLHAPLQLLESRQCCTRCRAPEITTMLRSWASSLESRRAVYHASQLLCLQDGFVSPLQAPALLASSVVLCNFAGESNSYPDGNPIELCQEEVSGLYAIEKWIQHGGSSMVSGRALCRSNLPELFAWCQERLAMFPQSLAKMKTLMTLLS